MEWQVIVALVIAIPIVTLPVAFIWYLNIGGTLAAYKEAKQRRAVRELQAGAVHQTNA